MLVADDFELDSTPDAQRLSSSSPKQSRSASHQPLLRTSKDRCFSWTHTALESVVGIGALEPHPIARPSPADRAEERRKCVAETHCHMEP